MQPSPKPPTPEPTDSEEVTLVLDAAIVLWATGKRDECIAAVRQAADCAERAGAEPRAAALRAAATELKAADASTRPSSRSGSPGRGVSHAPPPPSSRHAAEGRNGARPPSAPSATRSAPPPSVPPPPAPVVEPSPPGAPSHQAAPSASNGHARIAGSLHVWVRASARDPTLFLVRVLRDGESAPPGSYEAYLSPSTEGTDLRTPKH
jgi:hypothetical protein